MSFVTFIIIAVAAVVLVFATTAAQNRAAKEGAEEARRITYQLEVLNGQVDPHTTSFEDWKRGSSADN